MRDLSKVTDEQGYATFLPAISGFYTGMMYRKADIPQERLPKAFEHGMDGLNFLDDEKGYFYYNKALFSAGHAYLDLEKSVVREAMVQQRNRDKITLVGDSGGFQIGKGVIKFDWENFYEKKGDPGYKGAADKVRQDILEWLEFTAEWSMTLDVPSWATTRAAETGLHTFNDCLRATLHNNEYFLTNRKPGATKFLNVLQGGDWNESCIWYEAVKDHEFEGWGMGGQHMRNMYIVLKRLIIMRDEGKLDGKDWIHFLGTSKLNWACFLTAIQRQLRKHINPNVTVSFDCASPFIATANGLSYTAPVHTPDRWTYTMDSCPDNKALKGNTMPFPFQSEIGSRLTMGDVCAYGPGDLNKIGKEGKTSWDSFSYGLVMAHNVNQHIVAVQQANALADIECARIKPDIRDWKKRKGNDKSGEMSTWVPADIIFFNSFVEELFEHKDPHQFIEDNKGFLSAISNNANNSSTNSTFSTLFDEDAVGKSKTSDDDGYTEEEAESLEAELMTLQPKED